MQEEKTFICRATLKFDDEDHEDLTVGKSYKVIEESKDHYVIINDNGARHYFSKSKDKEGHSYKDWFDLG